MNRPQLFVITFLCVIGLLLNCSSAVADKRPNILLVMVDDMGYSDIGCYGGDMNEEGSNDEFWKRFESPDYLTDFFGTEAYESPSFCTGRIMCRRAKVAMEL